MFALFANHGYEVIDRDNDESGNPLVRFMV